MDYFKSIFLIGLLLLIGVAASGLLRRGGGGRIDSVEIGVDGAVKHIVDSAWGWRRIGGGDDIGAVEDAAIEELVRLARQGRIVIRGRAKRPAAGDATAEILPPEFWTAATICARSLAQAGSGGETCARADLDGDPPPVYERLSLDRARLVEAFPPSNVLRREYQRLRLTRNRWRTDGAG